MTQELEADICIIGAGSGGLSVAAGASQLCARSLLIERGKMGGDCLNSGCVPSKSLLVAAKAAAFGASTAKLGVTYGAPSVDFQAVHDHVHGVIASIAPMDSVERFEGLGVTVLRASARFVAPRVLEANGRRIKARRFVIATGSQPAAPPISGLDQVPYLTNESVFDLTTLPRHLIVLGGGPIGCELGQAFRRLGAEVSIVEMASILPKDDPELVEILRTRLRGDGITLYEQTRVIGAERDGAGDSAGVALRVARNGQEQRITGSALLLAAGRRPTIEGLNLEAAGIAYDRGGIKVDARLRTSDKRVYAMGDVAGGYQFTHVAGYHAGIVIRNALFRLPAKADMGAIPWVTYCDPELAHVGLAEEAARAQHGKITVLRWPFAENDRAQTERKTDGLVKAIVTPGGRVLGASIVGAQAGELIQPWVLALSQGLKIGALATMVAPYPTLGEASKRAAGSFYAPKLFGARTKAIVRLLGRLG
ncbi:MAG: dihydrolipoyl dehydrogenase family protein [Kiloniellales bacterium]